MNVLKRAYLYGTRKKGKSLTLFFLFVLITLFLTISFYVLGAAQTAAANLRETVGASFSLHGKPMELSKVAKVRGAYLCGTGEVVPYGAEYV